MNHKAIYALYPTVVTIDEGTGAFDRDGNRVEINQSLVSAWVDPNRYKDLRKTEYPPLADFADAMYWASQGDNTKLDNYYAACEAVKLKYPKS